MLSGLAALCAANGCVEPIVTDAAALEYWGAARKPAPNFAARSNWPAYADRSAAWDSDCRRAG